MRTTQDVITSDKCTDIKDCSGKWDFKDSTNAKWIKDVKVRVKSGKFINMIHNTSTF